MAHTPNIFSLLRVFFRPQQCLELVSVVGEMCFVVQRELARQKGGEGAKTPLTKTKLACTLIPSEQSRLSAFVYLELYSKKPV